MLIVIIAAHSDEASCRAQIPHEQQYLIEAGEDFIVTCAEASLAPRETLRPTLRPDWFDK
jgi:hypothetical protein